MSINDTWTNTVESEMSPSMFDDNDYVGKYTPPELDVYVEGNITYEFNKDEGVIYKTVGDGSPRLIPEEDWKYVPTAAGGTRDGDPHGDEEPRRDELNPEGVVDGDGNLNYLSDVPGFLNDKFKDVELPSIRDNTHKPDKNPIQTNAIMGLPLNFHYNSDPNGRVFSKTLLKNAPILTIVPGKPYFNNPDNNLNSDDRKDILKQMVNFEENEEEDILKMLSRNIRGMDDLRYFSFQSSYRDYFDHVQLMLSTLHTKMGNKGFYHFNENDWEDESKGLRGLATKSLTFFVEKNSSITEDASNSYNPSMLGQKANEVGAFIKELRYLVGVDKTEKTINDLSSEVESSTNKFLNSDDGFISQLANKGLEAIKKGGSVINGSNLIFPEIWADSQFSRSYSLSFKFVSPYGDTESIFNNVYVPFISLLALTLPRQDSIESYTSPFLIRADSPGWFSIDMGVVTSMTFKKGGSDELRSSTGLPLEIEVTLNIKDLYPALTMTKSYSMLRVSTGMFSFLETLAGVGIDEFKLFDNWEAYWKEKLNFSSGVMGAKQTLMNISTDMGIDFLSKINRNILGL